MHCGHVHTYAMSSTNCRECMWQFIHQRFASWPEGASVLSEDAMYTPVGFRPVVLLLYSSSHSHVSSRFPLDCQYCPSALSHPTPLFRASARLRGPSATSPVACCSVITTYWCHTLVCEPLTFISVLFAGPGVVLSHTEAEPQLEPLPPDDFAGRGAKHSAYCGAFGSLLTGFSHDRDLCPAL